MNQNIELNVLGFCGKFYLFIIFEKSGYTYEHIFKSFSDIKYQVLSSELFKVYKGYYQTISINEYLSELNKLNLFKKYNSPLLLLTPKVSIEEINKDIKYNIIVNPDINAYNFEKIFNPYTFFQELEMFIGNVLTTNQTPKMPDNVEEMKDRIKTYISKYSSDIKKINEILDKNIVCDNALTYDFEFNSNKKKGLLKLKMFK